MRHLAIAAWTIGLCALTGAAQEAPRKEPVQYAGTERAPRAGVQPPGIRLGLRKPHEFALAPLSESEVARFTESSTRLKVGIERSVPPEALSNGAWETTLDGARVWRMAIRSPGSRGIRIEFRNFSAGAGQVWLHDGSRVAGPYTNRGTFDDGRFWSDTLFSESATLEYEPAADAPAGGLPPFEIHTISHHIRSVFG